MTPRFVVRFCSVLCSVLCLSLLCAGVFGFAQPAAAQDAGAQALAAGTTPPARVGHLAYISGNARMRVDRGLAWEPAALNMPITAGTAVATQGSGGEIRVGSTALHMAPDAQVVWTELDDTSLHVEVVSGMVSLRVRALPAGERVLISAGGVKVQMLKPGHTRIRHVGSGTRVVVWVQEGQARVALNPNERVALNPNERVALGPNERAAANPNERVALGPQETVLGPNQHVVVDRKSAALLSTGASDEARPFDGIVEMRDRRREASFSLLNLPAEMTGAEALDGHGQWRTEAGYGAVWFADNLPQDWAPYRVGRWRWLAPWGWTWIDDAAWGFAPFHYGRWLFLAGRWGWVPGQATAASASAAAPRPVYAPALVGFFGNAPSAVWTPPGAATPTVGWYPLAPGEIYWPAYTTQLSYVRALNAGSVADLGQIQALPASNSAGPPHRFARTAFAASAMPYAAFVNQQDVVSHPVALPPAALAQVPLSARRWPPPRAAD
jgi:hypothetical protein